MRAAAVARALGRSLRRSRSVRWALVLGALYVAMDLLFTLEMGGRGLLSPEGSVHFDAVALGIACIGVRVIGRVVLPVLLGVGLASAAVEAVVAPDVRGHPAICPGHPSGRENACAGQPGERHGT